MVQQLCTYEPLGPAYGMRNLLKLCQPIHNGGESWRWIPHNTRLSVDCELYH
jgi:hypothetical protein